MNDEMKYWTPDDAELREIAEGNHWSLHYRRLAALVLESREATAHWIETARRFCRNADHWRAAIDRVEVLIGDCAGHAHIAAEVERCPWCKVRAALKEA